MIDTNKLLYGSMFSGFSNDAIDVPFSASYAGGSLAAGTAAGPIRASRVLDNADDISHVQVQFSGLESFYRLVKGVTQVDYPTRGTRTYSIEVFTYYSGGTLYVDSYLINQTGVSQSIPAVTFNCLASTFITPL
jgi:hypothetical protein